MIAFPNANDSMVSGSLADIYISELSELKLYMITLGVSYLLLCQLNCVIAWQVCMVVITDKNSIACNEFITLIKLFDINCFPIIMLNEE